MGDTIILTKLDEHATDIIDRFEAETGLHHADDDRHRRIFHIEGSEHGVDVVRTLTGIDEHWPAHVGLADPV